jgi:uncharacterized protein YjbI with pentapeptide repeats
MFEGIYSIFFSKYAILNKLRYATLCYAMLRYATLCYAMLRYSNIIYAALIYFSVLIRTTLIYATPR